MATKPKTTTPAPRNPSTGRETPRKGRGRTEAEDGGSQVREFVEDLVRQGRSTHTLAAYQSDLAHFASWFLVSNGEEFAAGRATPTDIRGYKSHLQAVKKLAPATVNRRLAALKTFFKWAIGRQLVATDPTAAVEPVPRTRLAPKALSRQELNRLTRAAEQDALTGTTEGRRNLAIVQILRYTGIRVGEITALAIEDLTLSERAGQLTIRAGKGGKFREVPLNAEARRALRGYLAVRPTSEAPLLFLGQRGALTASAVRKIVEKYGRRAGIEGLTPHVLRHSCARALLDAGVDLVSVAALLGHENLKTTAIYTKPSAQDLERAVSRLETAP